MSTKNNSLIPSLSFENYNKIKQNLVDDLQQLANFSQSLKLNQSVVLITDVLQRIKKESFTVAIVGEFKRGKSTFINALLGQEILPADILPCSATLNRVTYGENPLVIVQFKDGRKETIAIDQLEDYITKLSPESETTAESIQEATVYYPADYCKNNVDLIDTPGLNDDENMTAVTLSVLPHVDVAILVILAQSPFSKYEQEFLEKKLLTNDLGRIIFVVTGIDRLNNPAEADRLINHIEMRIEKYIANRLEEQFTKESAEYQRYQKKIGKPKIFGLSAYQALTAKQTKNTELLTQSRFPAFETALEQFLTQERGAILLQVPLNRILSAGTEIIKATNIQEVALQMQQEQFIQAYEASVTSISVIRDRKKEEIEKINTTEQHIKKQITPLVKKLEQELIQTIKQTIRSTEISTVELKNSEKLLQKLGNEISNEMRKVSEKFSNQIESKIQQGLQQEIERLEDFSKSVMQTMQSIEMQFQLEPEQQYKGNVGEGVAITTSLMTGLGGIWSGYRIAGLKGAAVGAAGSVGTALGAGLVIGAIGAPITLPIMIGVGIVSIFTGGWLTKKIFGNRRIDQFKTNYEENVLIKIKTQLQQKPMSQQINNHISTIFSAFKQQLDTEVELLLDNTKNTLTELKEKRERDETFTEEKQQELNTIRTKTKEIISNAQQLLKQLM